jgi:hypothetical protein
MWMPYEASFIAASLFVISSTWVEFRPAMPAVPNRSNKGLAEATRRNRFALACRLDEFRRAFLANKAQPKTHPPYVQRR